MDVGEVADALAKHGGGVLRKPVPPLEQHDVERLLRAEVLPDELLHPARQLAILENLKLHVEDRRLLRAGGGVHPGAELPQPLLGAPDGLVQARDLVVHVLVRDDAVLDVRHLPAEEVHVTHHDAR